LSAAKAAPRLGVVSTVRINDLPADDNRHLSNLEFAKSCTGVTGLDCEGPIPMRSLCVVSQLTVGRLSGGVQSSHQPVWV